MVCSVGARAGWFGCVQICRIFWVFQHCTFDRSTFCYSKNVRKRTIGSTRKREAQAQCEIPTSEMASSRRRNMFSFRPSLTFGRIGRYTDVECVLPNKKWIDPTVLTKVFKTRVLEFTADSCFPKKNGRQVASALTCRSNTLCSKTNRLF